MSKGFFGKNTKFWMGQVPPFQTTNKTDANRWGDRVKVRIMGYHPAEGTKLPDSKLPWAVIIRPTTTGSLNRSFGMGIVGGETVFGLFLDEECTEPAILGVLARTIASADISNDEVIQQQSTEFKKIIPFFGSVQPSVFQILGGEGSGSQQPAQLPKNDFHKKNPDTEAKASAAAAQAAQVEADANFGSGTGQSITGGRTLSRKEIRGYRSQGASDAEIAKIQASVGDTPYPGQNDPDF